MQRETFWAWWSEFFSYPHRYPFNALAFMLINHFRRQYCVTTRSIFINIKTIFVCKLARGSVIKPRGSLSSICVFSLFIRWTSVRFSAHRPSFPEHRWLHLFSIFGRLAPVLNTFFQQCVISYTCSQSNSDGSVLKPSELDWLQIYDRTHCWKIVSTTGASLHLRKLRVLSPLRGLSTFGLRRCAFKFADSWVFSSES